MEKLQLPVCVMQDGHSRLLSPSPTLPASHAPQAPQGRTGSTAALSFTTLPATGCLASQAMETKDLEVQLFDSLGFFFPRACTLHKRCQMWPGPDCTVQWVFKLQSPVVWCWFPVPPLPTSLGDFRPVSQSHHVLVPSTRNGAQPFGVRCY